MSLKDLATGFVAGAVVVFVGPTLLNWVGVTLPSLMPAAAMQGELYGYGAMHSSEGSKSVGRTVTIAPRAAGRSVSSHTGNTIGYAGDLSLSPRGAFARLQHPGLTGTVSRFNRA